MDNDVADTMPDGWQRWLDWHRVITNWKSAHLRLIVAAPLVMFASRVAAGVKQIWQITSCPCQLSTKKRRCSWWRNSDSFGIVTSG